MTTQIETLIMSKKTVKMVTQIKTLIMSKKTAKMVTQIKTLTILTVFFDMISVSI
jgi:hypothetical protein